MSARSDAEYEEILRNLEEKEVVFNSISFLIIVLHIVCGDIVAFVVAMLTFVNITMILET